MPGLMLRMQLGHHHVDNQDIRIHEGKWVREVDKAANVGDKDNHGHGSTTAAAAISEVKS